MLVTLVGFGVTIHHPRQRLSILSEMWKYAHPGLYPTETKSIIHDLLGRDGEHTVIDVGSGSGSW